MLAVGFDARAHLGSQFAGGGQHQRAHMAIPPGGSGFAQSLQQRQGETRRLAGARLGTGKDIAALEHKGNGPGLNGSGFAVALIGHSTEQFGREAEFIE